MKEGMPEGEADSPPPKKTHINPTNMKNDIPMVVECGQCRQKRESLR